MPQESGISSSGASTERVPVEIFDNPMSLTRKVAERIACLIREHRAVGKKFVLGLPSGSTPIGVYQELIRMHREEGLDFSGVETFSLDEYYPIERDSLQSYYRFMRENFFDHVNIPDEHTHAPDGSLPEEEAIAFCQRYEEAIEAAGGFDFLLLGIGRSGHIGFNEPGSGPQTAARLIVIDEITRKDAASDFFGEGNVPRQAITIGVRSLLAAREIVLLATGEHKAPIVRRAVEEAPDLQVTASYLQEHPNAVFYLDSAAAGALVRTKTPWLAGSVSWDRQMAKRAVIWLSEKLGKAILTLDQSDFYRHNLHELVYAYDNIDNLCRTIFEDLRKRITYPDYLISGQSTIVFSPHPDDDVISMGGMLDKLVDNMNDVVVAYMTNGSVAVFDADVRRYLQFLEFSRDTLGLEDGVCPDFEKRCDAIMAFLENKAPGEVDTEDVRAIKANIRYAEAIEAIEVMGLGKDNARFLDMPFYKTGRVRKDPVGPADEQVVLRLLEEVRPDHVFVAGDLSDPHGTHRMCYEAIGAAYRAYVARYAEENDFRQPLIWLYRGAWQEWDIHMADVFLPLSKADLDRKVEAIYKHESQKDRAMFPGAYDEREFWQRARDRNTNTARALNKLGLPEFYAAEAYVTTFEL